MHKALIIFDSAYGNTAKVSQAVAVALANGYNTKRLSVSLASTDDVKGIDLLIVASPTQGGRPTESIQNFINKLPEKSLKGIRVAAFDTRFEINKHGLGLLLLMKTIGFAAGRLAKSLQSKGGDLIAEPEGFIVTGKEGPLKDGELQRAMEWAHVL